MYAIIISGGKQYKIEEDEEVLLEKIRGNAGDKVELGEVIFLSKNGEKVLEKEELSKVKIKGEIVEQTKDEKIIVFKYKPKKGYRRKRGHRQLLTKVKVEEIDFPGKPPKAVVPKEEKKEIEKEGKEKAKAVTKTKVKATSEKKPAKPTKAAKEVKKAEKKSK